MVFTKVYLLFPHSYSIRIGLLLFFLHSNLPPKNEPFVKRLKTASIAWVDISQRINHLCCAVWETRCVKLPMASYLLMSVFWLILISSDLWMMTGGHSRQVFRICLVSHMLLWNRIHCWRERNQLLCTMTISSTTDITKYNSLMNWNTRVRDG